MEVGEMDRVENGCSYSIQLKCCRWSKYRKMYLQSTKRSGKLTLVFNSSAAM